ncbi:MAG: hypothetical protein GX456_13625 [Verrucomicrobia bacterium]|nr:hypothetical protein [Verrucomicrobiota bacterium]
MRIRNLLLASAVGAGLAAVAWADWNPGDPYKMHFPQLPDESTDGRDVLASYPYQQFQFGKVVADDWKCSETGPVTDIHIWGSWYNDSPDPDAVFHLAIFTDDRTGNFSQPGDLLKAYVFGPGTYGVRLYKDQIEEGFLDPNVHELIGIDTKIWQYNFLISDPIIQEKDSIYWLAVQAEVSTDYAFGWKTTFLPYEDRAVYGDNSLPGNIPPQWAQVFWFDPAGNPVYYDMAFVITTPEPQTYGLIAGLGLGIFGLARRFLRK